MTTEEHKRQNRERKRRQRLRERGRHQQREAKAGQEESLQDLLRVTMADNNPGWEQQL